MLLIFGGLPVSGKSTIAGSVARELQAAYIRVDTIEQTLKDEGFTNIYGEGYALAYKFAADNLSLGLSVVADSVNSISITLDAWRAVAESAGVAVMEIEIICSDQEEHKQRVETRKASIEGLIQPTWEDVLARVYEPWIQANIVIDTAGESPAQSLAKTLALIASTSAAWP